MPIWDPQHETLSRKDVRQLQLERLQRTVNRAYTNVAFYRSLFDRLGLAPEDFQSLDDLRHLPFTTKEDLRAAYPYDMFGVPLREIVRIHASSGTTGKQTVVGYTRNDLDNWAELVARFMSAGGVTRDDVVQIFFGYGMFTGAFGLHQGAERIGASVIPASAGGTERQIQLIQDFKTTTLVGAPSYALHIAEVMQERGVDPRSTRLRLGVFGSEPWPERMRQEIQRRLGILSTDNYGLSEVGGPGVSGECERQEGLHISEDHFLPEIIVPESGEVLPPGEEGELVLTTLTKEALPLLRYRTRDITRLNEEPCACGRTTARMARVMHRTDDMLIIRGVNIYPSQIEEILMAIEGVEPHYQITVERHGALDELEIAVEISPELFGDAVGGILDMQQKITQAIHAGLGLTAKVRLVEPRTLERATGKARRVIDKRQL
jgi:phenylacetate-CoA ligase